MVSLITRGPANPIKAPGSEKLISPSIAYDAVTPPVVGSVMNEKYGTPALANAASFAEVLAICISEYAASIIRAPPDLEIIISGILFSIQ